MHPRNFQMEDIVTKEDTKTVTQTTCLNCGTEFEGKFCPECGQRADTDRFTIKAMFNNLIMTILSIDGGVWVTVKSLFTRPGQMMIDILEGKRKKYFSPFPMLFLVLSLYIVIFSFTGSEKNNYDELLSNNNEIITEHQQDTISEVKNLIDEDVQDVHSLEYDVELDDRIGDDIENTIKWCLNFYINHYTIVFILTIPFYIFSARVCYGRRNRKKYYRGEYCIPIIYSLVIVVFYQCLTSIAFYFSQSVSETMDKFSTLVTVVAFTVCFKKMIGFSVIKMLWRSFLLNAFYVMLMVLLVLLAIVVYAIIIVS